jgi:hypothetical protein
MVEIRIDERTAADSVDNWRFGPATTFRLSKNASFTPGAQGFALGALRPFVLGEYGLQLECEFEEPVEGEQLAVSPLYSPFGYSLARLARSITFANGDAASASLRPMLASVYRATRGCIGSGRIRSFISIDPQFKVPPILVGSTAEDTEPFPPPSSFYTALQQQARSMGFTRVLGSNTESAVLEFVYESVKNRLC